MTRHAPEGPAETQPIREEVLRAEGLSFNTDGTSILEDVHLTLHPGEVAVLRGENGAGKTLLLNILSGHVKATGGRFTIGGPSGPHQVDFSARSLWRQAPRGFSPHQLSRLGVARAWQDIRLFPTLAVLDNLAVAKLKGRGAGLLDPFLRPRLARRCEARAYSEATEALQGAGLADRMSAPADAVSFGQAKRISLLRAAATDARLILLDEPLSGLDAPGAKAMLELIERLSTGPARIAFLIVEHDTQIPRLQHLDPRVLHLEDGRINQATRDTASTTPTPGIGVDGEPLPLDAPIRLPKGATLFRTRAGTGEPVLTLSGLPLRRGHRLLLEDVSDAGGNAPPQDNGQRTTSGLDLVLREGEHLELHAPNGWGKTTLTDTIMGLLRHGPGHVFLAGADLYRMPPWRRKRRGIQYVPAKQNVFFGMSVTEMLRFAGAGRSELHDLVAHLEGRHVGDLSGGEQKRLALVCALAQRPRLLLLDEPLGMLDHQAVQAFRMHLKGRQSLAILTCVPDTVS